MAEHRPENPPDLQDGRLARRRRVLLSGKIAYGDGAFSCDCSIRDLSASGARLAVKNSTMLPKFFHLIDLRSGIAYECEMIWRNTVQAGVRFCDAVTLAEVKDPKLRHLRRLYVEACLR